MLRPHPDLISPMGAGSTTSSQQRGDGNSPMATVIPMNKKWKRT